MTTSIANVSIASGHSFTYLINRVNDCITALNTVSLTSNSITTGNSGVSGTFSANNINCSTANVTNGFFSTITFKGLLSNTSNLSIVSNSSYNVSISANNINSDNISSDLLDTSEIKISSNNNISAVSANLSGTSEQIVDSFPHSLYQSADYRINIKDNNANNYVHSNISILCSGNSTFSTEYGIITSNNSLGVFNVSSNSTHAILAYQPVSSNVNINALRVLIGV